MSKLSRSEKPSYVTPPLDGSFSTIYEFLVYRFDKIPQELWLERISLGKVHFDNGEAITLDTPYQGLRRVCYYREIINEVVIPFKEKVLFEDSRILIVDKPHFLPIHPAGRFVNETLTTRLKKQFSYQDLIAAHRLDRLTAGLVLCVKEKCDRAAFQQLFMSRDIKKTYLAVGNTPRQQTSSWHIKRRMEPYNEHFRMQIVSGEPNSETYIHMLESKGNQTLFELNPVTGKKHQLRVHLASIGAGIVNDPLYPHYSNVECADDYSAPMQLLAHKLQFKNPFSNKTMEFESELSLLLSENH